MAEVPLFKNKHGNCKVVHRGKLFQFANGRYWTEDAEQIKALQALADAKDKGVYIDPQEPKIDTDATTPLEIMRKKIRAEHLAELEAEGKLRDFGTSKVTEEQTQSKIVGTLDSSTTGVKSAGLLKQAEALKASQTGGAKVGGTTAPTTGKGDANTP